MPRRFSTLASMVLAMILAGIHPSGLDAQADANASVTGSVTDPAGDPLFGVQVTVWRDSRQVGGELTTDQNGTFILGRLAPGRYAVRVEAFGFVPRVTSAVVVRPGDRTTLVVELRPGEPPFNEVDTVLASGGRADSRRWLESLELSAPSASRGLEGALELSSEMDRDRGGVGLPSRFTTFQVQGVPFRSAATGPGSQDVSPALSLGSTGLIRVDGVGSGSDRGPGGGTQVHVFNPTLEHGETDLAFSGSMGPMWNGKFEPADGLDPFGYWVAARTGLDLGSDSVRLVVGGDAYTTALPRLPLFPQGAPGTLDGQEKEYREVFSGFALLDWQAGAAGQVDMGVRVGVRKGAKDLRRLTYPDDVSPLEAKDFIIGGGLLTGVTERLDLSLRGGFTRSERAIPDSWPLDAGSPYLYQTSSGRQAGIDPLSSPTVRQGIYGSSAVHLRTRDHGLQTGLEVLRSTHELYPLTGPRTWVGAGDPFSAGWEGAASEWGIPSSGREFSVTRLSVFARDVWTPTREFELRFGVGWTRERIPSDRIHVDPTWAQLTGTATAAPAESVDGFTTHLGMDWESRSGQVRFSADVGLDLDEMNPWVLGEAVTLNGQVSRTDRLSDGGFNAWPALPGGGIAHTGTSLLLLPASLDLPSTAYAAGGLAAQVAPGWTVGGRALFRRTENLFRRVDLNLVATPTGVTDEGIQVWGTLDQRGTLVREVPGTSRRFQDFDRVWSTIQDGWSEYLGLTLFAERRAVGGVELSAWYTFSRTEDNLPGLSTGRAALMTPRQLPGGGDWADGDSDLNVPSRAGAAMALPFPVLEGASLRARYRFENGRTFTPGLAPGVDLNADGIAGNDLVPVPTEGLGSAGTRWSCLQEDRGGFASRNPCRFDALHFVDVGVRLGLAMIGGRVLSLEVEGLNLVDAFDTVFDQTLVDVDAAAGLGTSGSASVPTLRLNPGFGGQLYNTRDGRMLRVGIRWGGGE